MLKKILIITLLLLVNLLLFNSLITETSRMEEVRVRVQIQEEEPGIKVAFFGDAAVPSYRTHARSVYELVKRENAELIVMSGDIVNDEFEGAAGEWNAMVNSILGENFALISAIGNHDAKFWNTYPPFLNTRISRAAPNLKCEGEVGINMTCTYKDKIQVVLSGIGTRGSGHVPYAVNSLAKINTINWKVCVFHKVQRLMQVGGKVDEVGWDIYEECRKAGAIIATGHEHSYARTHLMSNFANQTIASKASNLIIKKGETIAFTAGTGGHELRDYESGLQRNPWWAKTYAEDDANATFGALFCNFKTNTADCYFKNIRNEVIDSFTLQSMVADPTPVPTPTATPTPVPTVNISPTPVISPTVIPSPTLSATPAISPTPTVDIALRIVDLNKDITATIADFVLFIDYYKTENCLVDYDLDRDCRDVDDFLIFASYYKDLHSN